MLYKSTSRFIRRKLSPPITSVVVTGSSGGDSETEFTNARTSFAANELRVGDTIRFKLRGKLNLTAVGPTCLVKAHFNASALGGTAILSATIANASVTNGMFTCEGELTIRSSTTMWPEGTVKKNAPAISELGMGDGSAGGTTQTVAIDTTQANILSFSAQFSANTANNNISVDAATVEVIPV